LAKYFNRAEGMGVLKRWFMSPTKKRITISVLALAVGIVIFLIQQFTAEPLHKGKPISYWVDRACADTEEARPFRDEVRQIGAAAVPRLKSQLQASDRWRRPYRWLQTHLADYWPEWLPDVPPAQGVRYGATETLKMLEPDAKQAVPDLIRLLPDSRGSSHYAMAPLQSIGPDAKAALPVLHSMLTNQDMSLRVDIAWALWSIGHETNTVLEMCTNAMLVPGAAVNATALVGNLGTAAAPAVPFALKILQDSLQDTNHLLAGGNAAVVLAEAHVDTPEIRAALLEGTHSGRDDFIPLNCAIALWRLDSQYAPLATRYVLEHSIADKKRFPDSKGDFTRLLTSDLDRRQVIPTLKELLKSDSSEMRKEAAEALRRIAIKTRGSD
jgi:HEAT repeat protein